MSTNSINDLLETLQYSLKSIEYNADQQRLALGRCEEQARVVRGHIHALLALQADCERLQETHNHLVSPLETLLMQNIAEPEYYWHQINKDKDKEALDQQERQYLEKHLKDLRECIRSEFAFMPGFYSGTRQTSNYLTPEQKRVAQEIWHRVYPNIPFPED